MSYIRTKLDSWCEGVLEAGWLAALVIAPLFFNVFSSRVFEPDKISLVRTIALMMALAWLIKIANGGYPWLPPWRAPAVALSSGAPNGAPVAEPETPREAARRMWRNPFFIPVVALIGAYLISTLFSLAPFVSWFGSYQRLQGTYSFLSYVTIALLTAATVRSPEQIRRLQHAVIMTSAPIAIYALIQHWGWDPLPWGGDTQRRVTANAGNAIFLAAYLIMAFFLTLERIYTSFAALVKMGDDAPRGHDMLTALAGGTYVVILIVQTLAIVWTQSRGPWLGLFLGSYLFVLLVLIALRPRRYMAAAIGWVGIGIMGVVLIFAMNTLPIFAGLRDVPYLGRLTQLLDQESTTAQVRTLIWQGSSELVQPHAPLVRPDGEADSLNAIRTLVGYGPEAMWVAFNKFYPSDLAQVEARNASPDRSHNETWDSLVITGVLGFLAYLSVFISIFYWALRWLGLLVKRRDTVLFFGLLFASAVAASIGFYVYDGGQLRLLGVAFPAGLMFGLLVYIMAAAFLHPDFRPDPADVPRQLLIIALLTAIVAHFVEIHFGIAIASTRTYFWVYTALLTTLGLRWAQTEGVSVALDVAPDAAEIGPAAEPVRSSKKGRAAKAPTRKAVHEPLPWTPVTVVTDVLIFLTTVFLYTTNSRSLNSATEIFFGSVTRVVRNGEAVPSARMLYLLIFTWIFALILGLAADLLRRRTLPGLGWWVRAVLVHGAIVWGAWLVYGLVQGARVSPVVLPPGLSTTEQLNYQLDRVGGHFAAFTVVLILWIVAAAVVYAWPFLSDRQLVFGKRPLIGIATGVLAAIAVFAVISFVNVGLVRADIIYKQGQQFDSQRNWVNSVELYRRALAARETEDHYMLFLGRALLEQAKASQAAEDAIPFPQEPTLSDVLALRPEQVGAMGRQQLLRAAETVLLQAQRVNPLNTDHTANLARLYRTWGDLSTDNPALRQEMLDKSIAQYQAAVTLSPQAAHLWNEMGNAYLARNERPEAEAAYTHSLSMDPYFEQTYLLLSDFYDAEQRYAESAAMLEDGVAQITALRGVTNTLNLQSYLGVALSQTGDVTGAIEAMSTIVEIQPNNAAALRNLGLLYRDAAMLEESAGMLQQAIDLTPADQVDQIAQLQGALMDVYQRAAAQSPDDYRWPMSMALLLQQQGQPDAALTLAREAMQLAPVDARAPITALVTALGG
jgi:tetratricopeptide (TPR) repeat protein